MSRREIFFLIVASVDIVGVMIFTIVALAKFIEPNSEDFTYAFVILANLVFCIWYVFSGVFREKIFEICTLIVSIAVIMTYCIADIIIKRMHHETVPEIKYVRLGLVCLGSLLTIPSAILVIKDFGFFEFRIVGANPALQRLYKVMAFYNSMLIIHLQMTISLLILVLQQGTHIELVEKITLGVGLPVIVLWTVLCFIMARYEKKYAMIVLEILGLGAFAYAIWKAVYLAEHTCFSHAITSTPMPSTTMAPTSTTPFCFATKLFFATTAAVVLFMLAHLVTLVTGAFVIKGFGQGLREKLLNADKNLIEDMITQSDSHYGSTESSRK